MRYQPRNIKSLSFAHRRPDHNKENHPQNREQPKGKDTNQLPLKQHPHISPPKHLEHKDSLSTQFSLPSTPALAEGLKTHYTQLVMQEYSQDILGALCQQARPKPDLLARHGITAALRSKMVDWMIEVLSSYKMSEETFFRSVYLMDGYLEHGSRLQVKDLHLVGISSMFSAGKYEEIHSLKMGIIYDKIARKKFTKEEILQRESDIINALDFKLEVPSVYDIARHVIEQLRIPLKESSLKYYQQIVLYLCKMCLFSCQLAQQGTDSLAGAVVFIAMKTLQQVDGQFKPEEWLDKIAELLGLQQENLIEVSRRVLDLAKNFSKYYPSLNNLKKFNKFEYGNN